PEPSDPWGRECLPLLQQLHRSSQQLWEVTEESLHSLQKRLRHPDSISLESLLLLHSADRVLQVPRVLHKLRGSAGLSEGSKQEERGLGSGTGPGIWGISQGKGAMVAGAGTEEGRLLSGMNSEGSVGTALVQALRQPLTHHVRQYVLLLLKLGDTVGEVGSRGDGELLVIRPVSRGEAEGREKRASGSGNLPTQEPWFEKDLATPWGHGLVLGGLKGHVLALGYLRYMALPWWSQRRPGEQIGGAGREKRESLDLDPDLLASWGQARAGTSFMRQELDQAMATQALWHTLSSRLRDVLCTPAHRLLQDSQDIPVTVTPLRAERVLLFDDALVLLQGHSVYTFDLKLVWVEPGQDGCMFHLLTPEEEFSFCCKDPQGRVAWQWKVTQAVCQTLRGKKGFPVLGAGLEPSEPPTCRCGAYTFRAEGRFNQATYEGEWYWGRPHGKGTVKWPDGRNHVGDFCQGLEHGFGIRLVPQASEDKFDCYKCHWREGSMCGYGICEYSTSEVYKGYFQEGLRHGFGVLESTPQTPQPCRYTGHWERGQRSGYGIEEDGDRGERYIGMWQADQRHGPGVMVTQAGFCYQGTFQADKMVGPGILLSEDDSLFEGTFTRDLTPVGKGKVTFPNGFTLEGSFRSGAGRGLHTQGVLDTAALPPDPGSTRKRQLGLGVFPMENRWQGVYGPFQDFVQAGCPGDLREALLGFHVQSSRELRKSQEYLCCERPQAPWFWGRSPPAWPLVTPILWEMAATPPLPLVCRGLLQVALQCKGQAPEEDEDAETSFYSELFTLYLLLHEREDSLYSQGIANLSLFPDTKLLEFLDVQKHQPRDLVVHGFASVPPPHPSCCFSAASSMLASLLHWLYLPCVASLLLASLGQLTEPLEQHLWPLKDLTLTTNQVCPGFRAALCLMVTGQKLQKRRYSLVRDKCFLSATECRPAGFSLASLPPVLLRAHPEGGHEAASLAQPLELQGTMVPRELHTYDLCGPPCRRDNGGMRLAYALTDKHLWLRTPTGSPWKRVELRKGKDIQDAVGMHLTQDYGNSPGVVSADSPGPFTHPLAGPPQHLLNWGPWTGLRAARAAVSDPFSTAIEPAGAFELDSERDTWSQVTTCRDEDSTFSSDREEVVKFFTINLNQDFMITRA
ncbi:hypothetical protein E2I00_016571, partial [Balaenoptera physalus]